MVLKSISYDFITKVKADLETCNTFSVQISFTPAHYSGGCYHRDSWELRVKAHPYFAKKYHWFYDDYKHRRASKEALHALDANGLANWYMCDGYVCLVGKNKGQIKDRRIDICTDRYSRDTVEAMRHMLKTKFQLDTSLIQRNHTYRIRISKSSYQRFFDLIHDYLVPSMQYKLYLGYEQQPAWMSDEMWQYQMDLHSAITQTALAVG